MVKQNKVVTLKLFKSFIFILIIGGLKMNFIEA